VTPGRELPSLSRTGARAGRAEPRQTPSTCVRRRADRNSRRARARLGAGPRRTADPRTRLLPLSTFCTVSVLKVLADAGRVARDRAPGATGRRVRPGAGCDRPRGLAATGPVYQVRATAARAARPLSNYGDSLRTSRSNSPSFGTTPPRTPTHWAMAPAAKSTTRAHDPPAVPNPGCRRQIRAATQIWPADRAIFEARTRFGQPNACSTRHDSFLELVAGS
jgi:hypothetical protein